jgi:hypothetical protein
MGICRQLPLQETSLGQRPQRILLRNEAQLNFVLASFPFRLCARGALWENCCYFPLDHAGVVIDGILRQPFL